MEKKMKHLLCIFCLLILTQLPATIINIPSDQPTIQAGINEAVLGDTVLVQPGTYLENINFNGKSITVASLFLTSQDSTNITQTTIDGNQTGSCVTFESGENSSSKLTGFTISNGTFNFGGGIYCYNSDPQITNSILNNNNATFGGGVYCSQSSPILQDVTIAGNIASDKGGGLYCTNYSNPELTNVTITYNSTTITHSYGGGIACYDNSDLNIENSTISYNSARDGGGIFSSSSQLNLNNVTLASNSAITGGGVLCKDNSNMDLSSCLVSNNHATYGSSGGLYIRNSTSNMVNVLITENTSQSGGGGLTCEDDSIVNLDSVIISFNSAEAGGGIRCQSDATINLENTSITNNFARNYGGGITSGYGSTLNFSATNRCNIHSNTIIGNGSLGADIYNFHAGYNIPTIHVIVDSFTVSNPTDYYTYPIDKYIFDVQNTVQDDLVNADLYVSVDGDDSNSGLDASTPLKTIEFALSRIYANSNVHNSIYLSSGTFSLQATGESYPLNIFSGITIEGDLEEDSILDAEMSASVFQLYNSANSGLKNLIIKHGFPTGSSVYSFGGGINCQFSDPSLENLSFTNNHALRGGGAYFRDSNPTLINVTINDNSALETGGGIYFRDSNPIFSEENRCNIYDNNLSGQRFIGTDVSGDGNGFVSIVVDTFTVLTPTNFHASPLEDFSFDILNSFQDSLINADLYVSVDGNNSNSGLTPDAPFKTIQYSLSRIYADSLNSNTIHLAPGIYSQQTNGESFPIDILSFVSVEGNSENDTFLDAGNNSTNIRFLYSYDSGLKNVTVRNGFAHNGGGIYCEEANPIIENIIVENNIATSRGGGIFCFGRGNPHLENVKIRNNTAAYQGGGLHCYGSNPELFNVVISGNSSSGLNAHLSGVGGGVYLYSAEPIFDNVKIIENSAVLGGGIFCGSNSIPNLQNVTISNNSASENGGGIYLYARSNLTLNTENRCSIYSNTTSNQRTLGSDIYNNAVDSIFVVVDTFTVLNPTDSQSFPIGTFYFDILNSAQNELINADVYVSIAGDNSNSGLNPDDSFKTIQYALTKIYADSLSNNTIHVAPGVYSYQTNGELYPIDVISYVSIVGDLEHMPVLQGDLSSSVIRFNSSLNSELMNFVITNGNDQSGGGVSCFNSNPILENLIIKNNTASYGGAGMSFTLSNPKLINCLLSVNFASNRGGGLYFYRSEADIYNVSLTDNTASVYGGSIYQDSNSHLNLVNTISWNNFPDEIYLEDSTYPSSITVEYSNILGGYNGVISNGSGIVIWLDGNLSEDPLFNDPENEHYSLQDISPSINAGLEDISDLDLPQYDLLGNPRVIGDRIDMGAYENQNVIVSNDEGIIPLYTKLYQNHPNPFNPSTTIEFSIKSDSKVEISIFNIKGQLINTLTYKAYPKGSHSIVWNGDDKSGKSVSSAIYYYKLTINGKTEAVKKCLLLK